MPGIFGFSHPAANHNTNQLFDKMANALHDEPSYQVFTHTENLISLGRIGLTIIQPLEQPAWNENNSIAVVMEGEIYNYAKHRSDLERKGHQFRTDSHAELFAHYYEQVGLSFLTKLNGAFAAALWDRNDQILILTTDHLGLQPLYYTTNFSNHIAFASGIRSLLAHPNLSRERDFLAISQFLTFDHLLDDRTLLANVKLLRGGSTLAFSKGSYRINQYWRPAYLKNYPVRSENDYQEELRELLKKAINRQIPDRYSAAILMSGGLDSRIIAAILKEQSKSRKIQTFTMGQPGCDDERFAKETSKILGMPHDFFRLDGDYLIRYAEKGVRLSDGMGNIVHMHTLPNLDQQARQADVIYKGFLGDALIGYGITNSLWANYDEETLPMSHFAVHSSQGLILFKPKELNKLIKPQNGEIFSKKVMAEYTRGILAANTSLPADQRNYFDLCQRIPRMTLNGVTWVRSLAHVRLPFADKDLVEFMLTVPPGYRFKRKIIKDLFINDYPELAKIPNTETNYPMVNCMRGSFMRLNEQSRWWLRGIGLKWVKHVQKSHYALYNHWMRNELKDWVQDILLSKRFRERGYFNSDYVSDLVKAHMSGEDHNTRLGALISIELWHRQYLDNA